MHIDSSSSSNKCKTSKSNRTDRRPRAAYHVALCISLQPQCTASQRRSKSIATEPQIKQPQSEAAINLQSRAIPWYHKEGSASTWLTWMHDKWSRTVCNHMLTRRLKQHTRRRRKPDSRSGNWLDQKTRQANKNKQLEATPVRAYEAGNMNKKRITDFMYWSINCLTQIVVSKVAAACSTTSPPIYYYENSWMTRRQHHLCWSCRPAGWRKKKPSPGPAVQLGAEERRYHHLVLLTSWVKKEDIYETVQLGVIHWATRGIFAQSPECPIKLA